MFDDFPKEPKPAPAIRAMLVSREQIVLLKRTMGEEKKDQLLEIQL